ncbi:hypothetical protein QFC22_000950 [Naganishia vaughanmartiniae]|uniref:Uncharacterized protein n=1 Tax=Naganishia vaughanmartiniae TaxID=1424756 RepID=A0ACC2XJW7_9TREE|nr:hypothetical protein QFC22_000950 [Naganishia vaughanmartiniae]
MTDHTLDPSLLDSHFQDASSWLTSTPAAANLPTDTKLEIYGLYKVATIGFRPDIPQPGFFSLPAAKAKYSAWHSQGEKYLQISPDSPAVGQAAAKQRYLEIAQQIGWKAASDEDEEGSGERKRSGMGMAGLTPLHLAADRGHAHIAQYLLNNGADKALKVSADMAS